jgi:hypothetical protein
MLSTLAIMMEIRKRPGMYLGAPSLTKLEAFLNGYQVAAYYMDVHEPRNLVADFRDWIHTRYKTTKAGWDALILRDSKDEADAFDHCWRLFDEFLASHPEYQAEIITPTAAPSTTLGNDLMARKPA